MRRGHYAPHAWYAEQKKPFFGIGKIADVAKLRNHLSKLERRACYQKSLRPGETLQLNAENLPHPASTAVCSDQPTGGRSALSRRSLYRHRYPVGVLFDIRYSRRKVDFCMGKPGKPLGEHTVQLVLLTLYAEGMACQIRNKAEIKFSDPASEVAVLQSRCDQNHLDQPIQGAELRQQVERRRVEGRCT